MSEIIPSTHLLKDGRKILVRTCVESDAQKLMQCAHDYLNDGEGQIWEAGELELTHEKEIDWIQQKLANPRELLLVAEFNSEIIGNLEFTAGNRRRLAHVGEFGMAVLSSWRGLGVGAALLKSLILWAESHPVIEKINLQVLESNQRAINLYRKFGFKTEGCREQEIKYEDESYANCLLLSLMLKQILILIFTISMCTQPLLAQSGEISESDRKTLTLAFNRLQKRQYLDALHAAKPLLANEPAAAYANELYGIAYFKMGSPKKALPHLKAAYNSNPRIPGLTEFYCDALVACKEYDEALIPALSMIATEDSEDKRAGIIRAKVRRVLPHLSNGRLKEGIDKVGKTVPEGPQLCSYYLNLAHLLDYVGKKVLAIECYTAGLAARPENPYEYLRKAHDMELLNQNSDAITSLYLAAIKMSPEDPRIAAAYKRFIQQQRIKRKDIAGGIKNAISLQKYR